MGFTCNTFILRTPTGILKIVEIVLVLICLLMLRFGGNHCRGRFDCIYGIGDQGDLFLATGTFVGYAIIVPCVLMTYLFGASISILELFINLVGAILFIISGVLIIDERNSSNEKMGWAIGVMAIATGVIFLVDFILAIKNTKFTVVQTTRTI